MGTSQREPKRGEERNSGRRAAGSGHATQGKEPAEEESLLPSGNALPSPDREPEDPAKTTAA